MSRRVNITGYVLIPEERIDDWDDEEEVRNAVNEMTGDFYAVGEMKVIQDE